MKTNFHNIMKKKRVMNSKCSMWQTAFHDAMKNECDKIWLKFSMMCMVENFHYFSVRLGYIKTFWCLFYPTKTAQINELKGLFFNSIGDNAITAHKYKMYNSHFGQITVDREYRRQRTSDKHQFFAPI